MYFLYFIRLVDEPTANHGMKCMTIRRNYRDWPSGLQPTVAGDDRQAYFQCPLTPRSFFTKLTKPFFESGNLFLFKFFVNIRVNIECWNKSLKSSQASANRLKPNFSFHLLNPKWCQPPRFPARLLDAWQEEDVPGTAGEIQQGERLGRSVELGQDAWPGRCHVWIRI